LGKVTIKITKRRKGYGGKRINQAKRLKELEKENNRLKRLVADISLNNVILKDVAEGNLRTKAKRKHIITLAILISIEVQV